MGNLITNCFNYKPDSPKSRKLRKTFLKVQEGIAWTKYGSIVEQLYYSIQLLMIIKRTGVNSFIRTYTRCNTTSYSQRATQCVFLPSGRTPNSIHIWNCYGTPVPTQWDFHLEICHLAFMLMVIMRFSNSEFTKRVCLDRRSSYKTR